MLYEEHADLLECLAQQELELALYKEEVDDLILSVSKKGTIATNGANNIGHVSSPSMSVSTPSKTHDKIKDKVIQKYGNYIDFRE